MTSVTKVQIEGLAGRSVPVECELNDDLNVFFGLNGSGKTTLLKLIYSALRDRADLVVGSPFSSGRVEFYSVKNQRSYTRSITNKPLAENDGETIYQVVETDTGELIRYPQSSSGVGWRTRPQRPGPFAVTYLSTSRLAVGSRAIGVRSSRPADSFDEARLDKVFAEQLAQLWRRYANRALSDVRQIQEAGLAEILQSLFSAKIEDHEPALDAKMAYQRANDFLGRRGIGKATGNLATFRRRYESDSRLASVVDDIDEIERQIERAEEPRRKLEALVRRFISPDKEINFSDREITVSANGEEIPLSSLSSGEKQLLFIMVEVINAEQSTVIIDEPELSMHIDWQRDLLGALRTINPVAQLIVATHSPEIMAEVGDESIFRI